MDLYGHPHFSPWMDSDANTNTHTNTHTNADTNTDLGTATFLLGRTLMHSQHTLDRGDRQCQLVYFHLKHVLTELRRVNLFLIIYVFTRYVCR